ncbi:MAG TPA: hypothetical protein VEB20_03015 [Azospirillaceae bacterium]|nr:hypothetical protein [Azospirillaceae bacterium]
MIDELLLASGAVGLMFIAFLWAWRFGVELRLRRAVGAATDRMRGVSAEKTQVLGTLEQQRAALTAAQAERARLRQQNAALRTEINESRARDFVILHQIGEPSKDKTEFGSALVHNQSAEAKQDLPAPLKAADHVVSIWAEEETTARRLVELQFPAKGPLRMTSFFRKTT